jgi:hypothetical protein
LEESAALAARAHIRHRNPDDEQKLIAIDTFEIDLDDLDYVDYQDGATRRRRLPRRAPTRRICPRKTSAERA